MAIDNTPHYVDALYHLYTFNMDMGDSMQELAEFACEDAGLDYGAYSDPDTDSTIEPMEDEDILKLAIEELVNKHSKQITNILWCLFTEENLLDAIFEELDLPDNWGKATRVRRKNQMLVALFAVDELLDSFPNGAKVKKALEDNILSRL